MRKYTATEAQRTQPLCVADSASACCHNHERPSRPQTGSKAGEDSVLRLCRVQSLLGLRACLSTSWSLSRGLRQSLSIRYSGGIVSQGISRTDQASLPNRGSSPSERSQVAIEVGGGGATGDQLVVVHPSGRSPGFRDEGLRELT